MDDDVLGLRVVQRTLAVTDEDDDTTMLVATEAPCSEHGRCREVALLDHNRLRWHAPIDRDDAVAVVGDDLIVATSTGLTARACATGSEQWHLALTGDPALPAVLPTPDGVALAWESGRLELRNPQDGARLATFDVTGALADDQAGPTVRPWSAPWGWYAFSHRGDAWQLVAVRSGFTPRAIDGADAGHLGADAWVGDLHLVARVDAAAFAHVPMPDAGGFALTLALAPAHEGDPTRTLLELGTGHWQPPTRAAGTTWLAFRQDTAGSLYALASDDGVAVLAQLGGPEHAVRWIRRIRVRSPLGAEHASTPVDFAVSPRRVALALDGGRILTLLDARHGDLVEFRADVVVQ